MQWSSEVRGLWLIARRNALRSAVIAAVVGTALVLINHGDHLASEPVCGDFWAKCALTYTVPFLVSQVSAALASRGRSS